MHFASCICMSDKYNLIGALDYSEVMLHVMFSLARSTGAYSSLQ